MVRAIIIPGNGGAAYPAPLSGNFYLDLANALTSSNLFTDVHSLSMPDPHRARRSVWVPHIHEKFGLTKETIVIGHSSGAECAMRLAEENKLYGIVIVAGCHTDLDEPNEAASGWYPPSGGNWDFDAMISNCKFIKQFHSADDPFIPINEAQFIADRTKSDFTTFTDRGHFFTPTPEINDFVLSAAQKWHTDKKE